MKRARCCDCNRRIDTNQRRHSAMANHLRPILLHYMGYDQDTDVVDFRPYVYPDSVFCNWCFSNIMNYKLNNRLPPHVVERLEMRRRAGLVRPCHIPGEVEQLTRDPHVKRLKEADPELFAHIADAPVPEQASDQPQAPPSESMPSAPDRSRKRKIAF